MKVRKLATKKRDSTDIHLMVSSSETQEEFDSVRIVEALVREAGVEEKIAKQMAQDVEKRLKDLEIEVLPVSLIRDFVNVEMARRGLEKKLTNQRVIGIPTFDLENFLYEKSNENSNISANNPEAVNLFIAETVLKEYAFNSVFSQEVSNAHRNAKIHVHDTGLVIRPYCSGHSLMALAKWGLDGWLVNLQSASKPASHARTLTGHLNTFLASVQSMYSGALGIGFLNIFYAPYVDKLTFQQMKQEAQYLIFSASQNAFSRGGQTLFIDFGVHTGIPQFLKKVRAIGPGGKELKETYGDFEETAQKFARALMEVWDEGDKHGTPFFFPKFNFHIDNGTFEDKKQLELYNFACEIASRNGSPYFLFDRDADGDGKEIHLAQCCRLRETITDEQMIKHPESIRFCGVQNVTINLPHASYRAKGNFDRTIEMIESYMDIAMKAHLQKKKFLQSLMKPDLPLWLIGKPFFDGKPYVDLDKSTYIIGMLGLNECVKRICGQALHESVDAYKMGMKIVTAMYLKAKKLAKESGLKVNLEESPAESASYRLAKVDLGNFEEAKDYVRGDLENGVVYYTNSVHYTPDAPISIFERIAGQSKFHTLIEAGAIVHVFVGEQSPSPKAIATLVKTTWEKTACSQLTFSPTFCQCDDCKHTWRGKYHGGK